MFADHDRGLESERGRDARPSLPGCLCFERMFLRIFLEPPRNVMVVDRSVYGFPISVMKKSYGQ